MGNAESNGGQGGGGGDGGAAKVPFVLDSVRDSDSVSLSVSIHAQSDCPSRHEVESQGLQSTRKSTSQPWADGESGLGGNNEPSVLGINEEADMCSIYFSKTSHPTGDAPPRVQEVINRFADRGFIVTQENLCGTLLANTHYFDHAFCYSFS